MITLHHLRLTQQQLDGIPDDERRLLILLGHAFNELNILTKLFQYTASASASDRALLDAENAQALVIARVLTGKIYECWKLLQSAFFATALSKTYVPQLDTDGASALAAVKRYFGRSNAIEAMRNEFAFHYSTDQIDAGHRAIVDGDSLDLYLANEDGNTFFAFADTITGRAMLERIKPGDSEHAFQLLMDDTIEAATNLNNTIASLMAIGFKRHFGENYVTSTATTVTVEAVPESASVRIPYFIEYGA